MIYNFIQKVFPPKLAYRNFIFIPLFFTFYIILENFAPSVFVLENFNGRPISIATHEGIDIGNRVAVFYKAIIFSVILILLFTRLIIILKEYFNEEELKITNGISLAGFCLLFFRMFGAEMRPSINLIFALLLICLAGFLSHLVKKRIEKNFTVIFFWSVLISISLFFLQWQVFSLIPYKNVFSLNQIIAFAGIPLYLFFTNRRGINIRFINASYPLIFLPLLSFVTIEIFMILNQHEYFISPWIIYFTGLALILFRCFSNYRKSIQNSTHLPFMQILFERWMPWCLTGISCLAFYSPVVQPAIDWFEDANRILPLHQWFSFGKTPFLDSYSAHALSDFGHGLIYSFFNGADPMGGFVYGFLFQVINLVIIYLFVYKITKDGFLSIWIAFLYPYTDLLLPFYFQFVPLGGLLLIMLYEKQSVKHYVFFFGFMIFMIFWRIDIGLSILLAGIIGFIILVLFIPDFKIEKRKLFRGLLFIVAIGFLIFLAGFIHSGSGIFTSMRDALSYMSSFQSYGIKDLSIVHDMKYFSLYFIFPLAILLIIINCTYNLSRGNYKERKSVIYCLAIIFLGIFYFSNLQRGLVRHTLAEQWDTALTSFGFFIITFFILLKYINSNPFIRFFALFIAGTVLISNYVFTTPALKRNNNYNLLASRLYNPFLFPATKEKVKRVIEDPDYSTRHNEFSEMMNNFSDESTFLDFSNTPMLYYFTNRVVPNYFVQIPHTAHNEYLQKRFIDDLKNYNIPVTVFSNAPLTFWDYLDGIPNTLRHFRISEYIYRNYKPAYLINNHSIWLNKNLKIDDNEKELLSINVNEMSRSGFIEMKENKFIMGDGYGYLSHQFNESILYDGNKIFMTMDVTSDKDGEIVIEYKSTFGIFDDKHKIRAKIYSGLNNLMLKTERVDSEKDISMIRIELPSKINLSFSSLKIFSSNYYKDDLSTSPAEYSLKWIPYIWGQYDENFKSGGKSVQDVFTGKRNINANSLSKFSFKPVAEKDSGNYLRLNARVVSKEPVNVIVSYGDANNKSGSFSFLLKQDTLFHDYLIRISSQYNWYNKNNSWIGFFPVDKDIEISQAEFLKGD